MRRSARITFLVPAALSRLVAGVPGHPVAGAAAAGSTSRVGTSAETQRHRRRPAGSSLGSLVGATALSASVLTVLIATGFLNPSWSGATSSEATTGSQPVPPPVWTSLVARPIESPHPVLAADGKVHLVYELLVTNVSGSVMKLENLEVLDASKGDMVVESESGNAVVATLQGSAFAASNSPFSGQPSLTVGPYQFTRLFLDVPFAKDARLPTVLLHRFQFTLDPAAGNPPMASATVVSGRTEVLTHVSPVVIGPPVAGPRWVDAIGCCSPPSVHRTATLPINGQIIAGERFDIDFVELNPEGKLYSGPDNQLSSYAYEGTEVLAVADGTVVNLQDGQPEQTPGSGNFPPALTLQQGLGNYVVLDIGHGHFAFYAHFQPHTLKVKVGERVHAGQVLARLGNSGNTDAPHLHFGIHDGPSVFSADSLPFVFSSFIVAGTMINSFDHDVQAAGMPAVIGPAAAGSHHNELPLENQVITFPK